MLAGNGPDEWDLQPAGDLLKEPHAIGVFSRVFAVVRQVSGEEHEIGAIRQTVDEIHRLLERLGAERVGRPRKAHVRVGQLCERKRGRLLSILLAKKRRDCAAVGGGAEKRGDLEERTHADRGARDFHERSSIDGISHGFSCEPYGRLIDGTGRLSWVVRSPAAREIIARRVSPPGQPEHSRAGLRRAPLCLWRAPS